MLFTPLLGEDNSEPGNIILGYIATPISLSQSLVLVETTDKTKVKSRSISESLVLTPSLTFHHADKRSISQSLGLSQTITIHVVNVASISQTLTLSETLSPTYHRNFHISQNLPLTQTITRHRIHTITVNQSLTLSQSVIANYIIQYNAALGQDFTRLGHIILGHIYNPQYIVHQALTLISELNPPHRFHEILHLNETITEHKLYNYTQHDTLTLHQNIIFDTNIHHINQTLALHQTQYGIKGTYYLKTINESLPLAERIIIHVSGVLVTHDHLNLVSTFRTRREYNRTFSDTLTLTETLNDIVEFDWFHKDTLIFNQTISNKLIHNNRVKQKLHFTETIHRTVNYRRSIHETIHFLNPVPKHINYYTTIYLPDVQYVLIEPGIFETLCCQT